MYFVRSDISWDMSSGFIGGGSQESETWSQHWQLWSAQMKGRLTSFRERPFTASLEKRQTPFLPPKSPVAGRKMQEGVELRGWDFLGCPRLPWNHQWGSAPRMAYCSLVNHDNLSSIGNIRIWWGMWTNSAQKDNCRIFQCQGFAPERSDARRGCVNSYLPMKARGGAKRRLQRIYMPGLGQMVKGSHEERAL